MSPAVTSGLQDIHHAETKAAALAATEVFTEKYGVKYSPAVACLTRDTGALLTFFDVPAEHRDHLRTSNPVESVFATARHRTAPPATAPSATAPPATAPPATAKPATKGALSQKTVKLIVFSLIRAASQKWRRLNGANQVPRVLEGITVTEQIAKNQPAKTNAD